MDLKRAQELGDKMIAGTLTDAEAEELWAATPKKLKEPVDWDTQPGLDQPIAGTEGRQQ